MMIDVTDYLDYDNGKETGGDAYYDHKDVFDDDCASMNTLEQSKTSGEYLATEEDQPRRSISESQRRRKVKGIRSGCRNDDEACCVIF